MGIICVKHYSKNQPLLPFNRLSELIAEVPELRQIYPGYCELQWLHQIQMTAYEVLET